MLTRNSFRKSFLGLICGLVFFVSMLLGIAFTTPPDFALDLTRTALCCHPIEALIQATQTGAVVNTEVANLVPTQTYIAGIQETIQTQIKLKITPTPN